MTKKSAKKSPKKITRSPRVVKRVQVKRVQAKKKVAQGIDRRLLDMASNQYQKLIKELEVRRQGLLGDAEVALRLGEKILTKVNVVRNSLFNKSVKKTRKKSAKKTKPKSSVKSEARI